MEKPKIAIIVLNWQKYDDTAACLRSLRSVTYPCLHTIVVDNGSTNGSADQLARAFPEVEIIRNEKNLGFAAGNNVGIKAALRAGADAVLLLNNDTIVAPDFLEGLVAAAWSDPLVGAVGPKIYYHADPDRIWFAGGEIRPLSGRVKHRGLNQLDCGQYDQLGAVDFLTGCAYMVKTEAIKRVGMLDEDYYLNFEDVDWSLRLRRAGYKLFYVPAAKVWHKWSVSFGGRFTPFYTYFKIRNSLLYLKKNQRPFLNFLYAYLILPVKTAFYTVMSGKPQSLRAVSAALRDYRAGRYGSGSAEEFR